MIVTISSELIQNGTYECYIKVNKDGDLYWVPKSVPIQDATTENKNIWMSQAIQEAEVYFSGKYTPLQEVNE